MSPRQTWCSFSLSVDSISFKRNISRKRKMWLNGIVVIIIIIVTYIVSWNIQKKAFAIVFLNNDFAIVDSKHGIPIKWLRVCMPFVSVKNRKYRNCDCIFIVYVCALKQHICWFRRFYFVLCNSPFFCCCGILILHYCERAARKMSSTFCHIIDII